MFNLKDDKDNMIPTKPIDRTNINI